MDSTRFTQNERANELVDRKSQSDRIDYVGDDGPDAFGLLDGGDSGNDR